MNSNSIFYRYHFQMVLLILFILSPNNLFAQKKTTFDTLNIKELYNTLCRWQQTDYDQISTDYAFDTIKLLSASSPVLKKIYSAEFSKYRKSLAYYKEVNKGNESVDAMTLFGDYTSNKLRAKNKYGGQTANINGVVAKIDEISGHKFVVLLPSVYCFFSESNSWYIEQLLIGQSVIIRGKIEYYMDNTRPPFVKVDDCEGRGKTDNNFYELEQKSDKKIFLDDFFAKTGQALGINNHQDSTNTNNFIWEGTYKAENGTLTIKNETKNSFAYELSVAFMGGSGDISGKAKISKIGSAVHYLNENGEKGQIVFRKKRNRISITEVGSAFGYHGAGATFQLDYYKDE